jgi:hypothetical protein
MSRDLFEGVVKGCGRGGWLRYFENGTIMCILRAGVAKLVYAPDSKSGEVHSSCRFESDLRHQSNQATLEPI